MFDMAPEASDELVLKGSTGSSYVCRISDMTGSKFTVSFPSGMADSWIKLPLASAEAGKNTAPVTFEANAGESRTGSVTFHNEEYDYTYVYTVKQFADGIYFFDDFNWLTPMIEKITRTIHQSLSAIPLPVILKKSIKMLPVPMLPAYTQLNRSRASSPPPLLQWDMWMSINPRIK